MTRRSTSLLLASMALAIVGCASQPAATPGATPTTPTAAAAPAQAEGVPVDFASLNIHAPVEHLMICVLSGPCTLWTEQELQALAQDFFNKGVAAERERASQGDI